ncbi:MAG: hypothetical protein GC178_01155 [Flavobacteriales bacterium]|nr:hypothetical protein [Flavobacteriales bacterium]
MRSAIFILLLSGWVTSALAQSTELYVFKDERKEALNAARKAREEHRAKAVSNDFYMRVRTLTSLQTAKMEVSMKKAHDAEVKVTDMNGQELATLHKGELKEGQYEFSYAAEGNLRKPLVCQLLIDGKTEAMKVVKFNAF